MESIDRLREWANGLHGVYINQVDHTITVTTGWDTPPDMDSVSLRDHINGILDAIEREAKSMRDFCERVDDAATKREDVTLWGVDYTALPVDAEGEPIHVGDVMEWDNGTFTVHELKVTEDGWTTWDEQHGYTVHVDVCHHHTPTVEDVLTEFAAEVETAGGVMELPNATLAEYAAKLTLRGDE